MTAIAALAPSLCTKLAFPHSTHGGRTVSYLKVTEGAGSKPAAFIIGGVHAREVAPPDIVLDFARELVGAAAVPRDVTLPAFTDPSGPAVTYAQFVIGRADIVEMVRRLEIYIAPLVNPDGRHFVLAAAANNMWRGNRRPNPPGPVIGVDLNRNFPIAWPFDVYYSANAVAEGNVGASHLTSDPENYVGSSAASEPETKNVQWLIDSKRVSYFLDLHSHGRKILYPWSIETNQHLNNMQSFQNSVWDRVGATGGRDGIPGRPPDPAYAEFFPNGAPGRLFDDHVAMANAMRDAMRDSAGADVTARARATYSPEQSIGLGYLSPGASDDYAFSRQFVVGGYPSVRAFTIECGSHLDGENRFHPPYGTKFPKIEREVHAGLFAFLKQSATRSPAPAAAPVGSGASSGASSSAPTGSGPCSCLVILGVASLHPDAMALRSLRDRTVSKRGVFGLAARRLVALYRRWNARTAPWLIRHPTFRGVVRTILLKPLVRLARRP